MDKNPTTSSSFSAGDDAAASAQITPKDAESPSNLHANTNEQPRNSTPSSSPQEASSSTLKSSTRKSTDYYKLFGARALAAGGLSTSSPSHADRSARSPPPSSSSSSSSTSALAPTSSPTSSSSSSYADGLISSHRGGSGAAMDLFRPANAHLASNSQKYLVIGDGLMAPFMALCLRVHGLQCDLAYHPSNNPVDRGTLVLTPSITQLMGDVLNVSVPSGSVIGRVLTFDHVGNDMCDVDLNEFRERGESPTFFCCDRLKVENALLSLCRVGTHSCHVWSHPLMGGGGGGGIGSGGGGAGGGGGGGSTLEALENGGVRVRFAHSGLTQDYLGVVCTSRNPALIPELTLTQEELQQRAENQEKYRENFAKAPRWMELCVPPLPELGKFEKRFTPGSQEIVEIVTPREAKLTVRPTMLATKLFYHVTMTIPDSTADPTLKSTSTKQFWDDVAQHWTAGVPGYVSHTLFRPMFTHMQQHFSKSSALVYKTPLFLMPHWSEGNGRLVKVAHAAHGASFDAIDVADAQGFTDCFGLARSIAESAGAGNMGWGMPAASDDIQAFLKQRRLEVMEELEHHSRLLQYGLKERGQVGFLSARFGMKIMRRYKKSWKALLQNYVTLIPKKH